MTLAINFGIFPGCCKNRAKKQGLSRRFGQFGAACGAIALCLFFAVCASAQTAYRDPGGNFTVEVPAGWHAAKHKGSNEVTLSKGDASISLDAEPTDDGSTPPPKQVLDDLEKQFKQQCPQGQMSRRGAVNLAGASGLYFQGTCKDPEQGEATMMVAAATTNGKILVVNASAFSTDYASVKPVLDSIIRSFRLSGSEAIPAAGSSNQASRQQGNGTSGPDAEKLRALEAACSAGVLTPDECAAKRAALTRAANSSASSDDTAKLQALERACRAGVFTPEECAAKRAALAGAGSNAGQGGGQAAPPAPSNGQNGAPQGASSNPPQQNNSGTIYNDPQGAFSLMIAQGWTAQTKRGCYGPPENCPPNTTGVNISQGRNWAFVAPYSADANQPTDVVTGVAGQYQSQYRNFKMLQNEPAKYNGLDIALGHFSGMEPDGVTVSLVTVGVAAPNGRYYVVSSSVAESDMQTAGVELARMLNTIRFAGQQ